MDMYVRMYDELKRGEGDNPTLGIILCSETDEDIARYSVLHGNEQLFASKYKLYLSGEEDLVKEKPFHSITLKEVCERAEINRSTFYKHYKDTYDWKEQTKDIFMRSKRPAMTGACLN